MTPARAQAVILEARRRHALPTAWYAPHVPTPKQSEFRALRDVHEALYGGAAGGGKSDELLAQALEYVHVPGYAALLLRRTYPQLSQPEGLIPRSHEWLQGTNADWSEKHQSWFFPTSGQPAVLRFGHLQHEKNKYDYQGGAYQYIGFDELTQFTESQYLYLRSRCRRPEKSSSALGRVPLRIRAGSNPGGVGHDWVKERFVDPGKPGVVYVPAKLADNPHLDAATYRELLAGLDDTTRRQLEDGEWIRDSQGLIYPYRQAHLIDRMPELDGREAYVLGIDLGSSLVEETTALVVLAYHPTLPGVWVVRAERHAGMIPTTLAQRVEKLEADYGGFEQVVMDEGALGSGYGGELRLRHKLPVTAAKKRDKLGYRKLLRGALERVELLFVEPQCEPILEEMGKLHWNESGTDAEDGSADHCTDALLYAWRAAPAYTHEPPETHVGTSDLEREAEAWRQRDIKAAKARSRRPWWQR